MVDRIDARPASSQAGPLSAQSRERLDRLFRLYSSRVLAYAVTRAKRPEDAHDIAGETWVRATRNVHLLRADDDRAMPWLAGIVRCAAVDLYRPKRADEQPKDWTDAVAAVALPAEAPADAEPVALSVLTPHQAAVWKLKAQGLSDRRIALRLGRSETAVWKRKHAGARRLRASLAMAG